MLLKINLIKFSFIFIGPKVSNLRDFTFENFLHESPSFIYIYVYIYFTSS